MLFESWLRHEVPPARYAGERISISFNYGWSPPASRTRAASCRSRAPSLLLLLARQIGSPVWADCPLDLGHGTGWVVFCKHYIIAFRPDPIADRDRASRSRWC